jgi:hypothetical protein
MSTTFQITFHGICLFVFPHVFAHGRLPSTEEPAVLLPLAQFGYRHETDDGPKHVEPHTAYVSAQTGDVIHTNYPRAFTYGAETVFPLFRFAELTVESGFARQDVYDRTQEQRSIKRITVVCSHFVLDDSTTNLAARMNLQGFGGVLSAHVPPEEAQYSWLSVTSDGNVIVIPTGDGTIVLKPGSSFTVGNEWTGKFQDLHDHDENHWLLYYKLASSDVRKCGTDGGPTVGCSNSNYP